MSGFATSPNRPLSRFLPNPKLKFLEQCQEVMRFKRLSPRTEEAYVHWIRRFILFHRDHPPLTPALSAEDRLSQQPSPGLRPPSPAPAGEGHPSEGAEREKRWRHPKDMGAAEVKDFLIELAVRRKVAASTQNQALCLVEG